MVTIKQPEGHMLTSALIVFPKPDGRYSVHECVKAPNHWRIRVMEAEQACEVVVNHLEGVPRA